MKRSILVSFLAAVTLVQSAAYADVIYDLPNLEEGASQPPTPPPPPPVRPSREEKPQQEKPPQSLVGKVIVKEISRKTGGAVYHVDLRKALPLTNVDIKILKGNLKVREGALITAQGERLAIREFKDVQVLPAGSKLFSENLNLKASITAIEIRAESYLETADIQIEATSDEQTPVLRLKVEAAKPAEQAPSRVSPIVVGDRVMYSTSSSMLFGEVLEIFQSGDIRVRFEGYQAASIVSRSALSKNVTCLAGATSSICKDDRVMYVSGGSYLRGFVKESFSSGLVKVLFDGYSSLSTVDVSKLAKLADCQASYCKGDKFLYSKTNFLSPGVVVETFKNGVIFVRLEGYSGDSVVAATNLTKPVASLNGFRVGDSFMYEKGNVLAPGTVEGIYGNGLFVVRLTGYSGPSYVRAETLSKSVRCKSSICANDKVLFSKGTNRFPGTVIQLYTSDIVQVMLQGYSGPSYVRIDTLTKQMSCVKSDRGSICAGDRVIYTNRSGKIAGTVKAVFGAENVEVLFDGYSTNSFVQANMLVK